MLKEYLSTLSNAFRLKLGTAEKINAQDFPDKVTEVYNAGYEKGKSEGGDTETAYNNGFEDGKQAEWNDFWDKYQDKGTKRDYSYAFAGYGWTDETFNPKYDVKAYSGSHIFSSNRIVDLIAALKKANNGKGVKLDTSGNNATSYFMQGNQYTINLPELDMRKRGKIQYFISGNSALQYIEKIILRDDGSQTFNEYSFNNNTALEHIRFEGVIGNNLAIADSPNLTHESLINEDKTGILDCLKDFSGTNTTRTLTLHAEAKARLSNEEIAIATQKGWTIA